MSEPAPGDAEEVVIVTTHVIKSSTGSFSVRAYDPMGQQFAHAPSIEGVTNWTQALATFWGGVNRYAEIRQAFGEQDNSN
jgi:hypothetical protein